ncbi:hypothetical protein [Dongia sp.]|uniref:hypothetical protein n=1 Tax=Dongia sp. TaxID=1977262 RepID=UPI00375106B0
MSIPAMPDRFAFAHGTVFACVRRDWLLERWRKHRDEAALERLLAYGARDLTPSQVRAERDAEIRRLAAWLRETLVGSAPSTRLIARLLGEDPRAVELLDTAERRQLRREIAAVSAWSMWPNLRQIITIIGEERAQLSPVEIAHGLAPTSVATEEPNDDHDESRPAPARRRRTVA